VQHAMRQESLYRLFHRLVNRSFSDLQTGDEALKGYVIDLLVRFARTDALYELEDPTGRQVDTVVGMLIEADRLSGVNANETFRVLRHTGDYALFMSGIFRAYVERHGFLEWYMVEGPRSYRRASSVADGEADREILVRMRRDFEQISGALDYMRKVYFGQVALRKGLDDLVRRFDLWN